MGRGKKPLLDAQGRKKCANCEEYKALLHYVEERVLQSSFGDVTLEGDD